ncbi:imidazole glycerol phosphate synthase subunit HisH [Clostridium kluyveri]|uniref:Imidazole glycerol phosphate synthase subunit HisH n=1 Tax=Clostridium kluyveri TaxID=1534 RepID=A0A1L5F6R6_CLOKL|nr:imidazole glycerol phosphate synthase subunit HisH [Clostridium kluyveri]APM38677.1 imidazole glycerol phosphate synthase subunit HisH [Clostridium kluyveri]UZQ50992.1 imidazole glycerol phosphate synthase subunit HisH [Clostridium kluyveri]
MISIIDYGMGNLKSVKKALKYIGEEAQITSDKDYIENSQGVILPGVGAFPEAMKNLRSKKLDVAIKNAVEKGIPLLGICLGMQLLFDTGEEIENCEGLGLIPGNVTKLYGNIKIPHMGWNSLNLKRECALLEYIPENSYVYFVHSFYADMKYEENLNACSVYGIEVPAVVSNGKVYGTQFHPEKSGDVGIKMLKNFVALLNK